MIDYFYVGLSSGKILNGATFLYRLVQVVLETAGKTSFVVVVVVVRAMLEEDPFTRMKMVVRWYLSGFYKKPKVHYSLCS